MEFEYKDVVKLRTWVLVARMANIDVIAYIWVFTLKYNSY